MKEKIIAILNEKANISSPVATNFVKYIESKVPAGETLGDYIGKVVEKYSQIKADQQQGQLYAREVFGMYYLSYGLMILYSLSDEF